jgi:hypothetical protein
MATNLSTLLSGRAIAASGGEIHVVNIYALSGTSKRLERETFFNKNLTYLLDVVSEDILLGGDFNCVLDAGDSTGHGTYSRSPSTLIHGCSLRDVWQARPGNTAYTLYTVHGATRLDRFLPDGGPMATEDGRSNRSRRLHSSPCVDTRPVHGCAPFTEGTRYLEIEKRHPHF